MTTHYFRTLKDTELKTLEKPRSGVWTHVVAPSEEELATLIKDFELDDAIVADIKDFFEVPRFERAEGALYLFTRYPFDERAEDIDTAPLLVVVGPSFVITIAQREVPFLAPFISGAREIVTTQKTKLFLHFMSELSRAFDRELTRVRKMVYRDRTRVGAIEGSDIQRLVTYEHQLNDAISAIVPTNTSLQKLNAGGHLQMYEDDVELMDDLAIANNQLTESARAILKTIQNVRSASEAILTQKLNGTIKLLTALTILLTIPTIVASLYGMNVPLPLAESPVAFFGIVILIVAVVVVVVWFFKRKRWL